MYIPGKQGGRPSIVAAVGKPQCLLFIRDPTSKNNYLVDTGAETSVIPANSHDIRFFGSNGPELVAANGSSIKLYGKRLLKLHFPPRVYEWEFTVAAVARPILGADFLRAHSLLVDIRGQRLVNSETFQSMQLSRGVSESVPHLQAITTSDERYDKLLGQFPEITLPNFSQPLVKHQVEHCIPTQGPPVFGRAHRRLPPDKLKVAKKGGVS